MDNNELFHPKHSPAIEFSILDKNDKIVLVNASNNIIESIPNQINVGNYTYKDGRRFVVAPQGVNSSCIAYVVDALWGSFKLHCEDIIKNKLWLRSLVPTENKEYKEAWDTIDGKEEIITCLGSSPQSFYTLPWMYRETFPEENILKKIIKVWNAYVGIPWVLLDRDPLAIIRAKLIRPYGKYKIVEFDKAHSKSLLFPNIAATALFSPALTWFMYALSREAIGIARSTNYTHLLKKIPPDDEIADVVNNHSLIGALELWIKGIRDIGINWYNSSYSSAFWNDSLPTFEWLIQNGGVFGLGVNPIKNWLLDRPDISGHCSTLMAWERKVKDLMKTNNTHKVLPLIKSNSSKIEENSIAKFEEMQK